MGFLDKALKQGKDLLAKNADKVDTVITKAGDLADKKTQGKYAGTINKVQDAAKKAADKAVADQRPQTPPPSQAPTPPNPAVPPVPRHRRRRPPLRIEPWRSCPYPSTSPDAGAGVEVCVGSVPVQGMALDSPGVA